MKVLTLILFLFSFNILAQKSDVFRIDSLPIEGLLLDKGWKFHAGDNSEWAKPDFDDSAWDVIDPTKDLYDLPQIRQSEIGWIRLNVWVDSNVAKKRLSIMLFQNGANEIYLNDELITQIGVISKNQNNEVAFTSNGLPYSWCFYKSGIQSIAVRFSFTKKNRLNNFRGIGNKFFKAILKDMDSSIKIYQQKLNTLSILDYGKAGFFLFMGLLYLFFFFFFKSNTANLYLGTWGLFGSILFIINNSSMLPNQFTTLYWYKHILILCLIIMFLAGLNATYSIVNLKRKIAFWVITFLILLAYPIFLFFYWWGWAYPFIFLNFVLAIEYFRISYNAIKRGDNRIRFFITAFCIYVVSQTIYILSALQVILLPKWSSHLMSNIAILCFPIVYALVLSKDFASVNIKLKEKLIENELLAAQTIAQEKEKQQILTTQNETLEQQVTKRTSELNQSLETLKTTQTQLIQKEKLASLGELTAGIAHEIQNPLNFVNNFSELSVDLVKDLKDEIEKPDIDKEYVGELFTDLASNQEKINHHGKRASNIVKGMLEHSRSSTGVKEPTDINKFVDESLRLSYHAMRAKDKNFNADYSMELDETMGKINIIPQDMGRVLINLINNAFYAVNQRKLLSTDENYTPSVSVTTQQLEKAIEIRVKDNDNGIPDSIKQKIFQPFFTTKPTGEGTGLGLSLSYDIVTKAHGGALDVLSTEGVGSEFIIRLPFKTNNQ